MARTMPALVPLAARVTNVLYLFRSARLTCASSIWRCNPRNNRERLCSTSCFFCIVVCVSLCRARHFLLELDPQICIACVLNYSLYLRNPAADIAS